MSDIEKIILEKDSEIESLQSRLTDASENAWLLFKTEVDELKVDRDDWKTRYDEQRTLVRRKDSWLRGILDLQDRGDRTLELLFSKAILFAGEGLKALEALSLKPPSGSKAAVEARDAEIRGKAWLDLLDGALLGLDDNIIPGKEFVRQFLKSFRTHTASELKWVKSQSNREEGV